MTFRAWCAELVANLAFEMATRTFCADTGGRVAFRLVPLWAATLSIDTKFGVRRVLKPAKFRDGG